ncbi:hypothetical protein P3T76_001038 [Phytophthora citrophthora]|uniref:Reverse transcriptase/retrotransposon-derived protein RNase H-like domain-containing protein n=1 Tax=Phytophthora citrophthora TaxID=4793 RepID=A0AAD9GZQ1_9STRA|nr:hypothetical protein P3T76_001038 [Phytophthora citrophthora]
MHDVFRPFIGRDLHVDMPPMEVSLKPGAIPVKCRARRYSPAHRAFLKKHINALIDAGLYYRNPHSRWCSPPHVVNKPEAGAHCMTVDVRGPNGCVDSIGFWQFALAVWCQEIYPILTEEGVITPTRVFMGGTNSVVYVQSTVQEMFAETFNNGLRIWIDDLRGVGEGVRHDPARITVLSNLSTPTTGQGLQQLVCALNRMRALLPAFNKLVDPLVKVMDRVYKRAGGRKKTQVRNVKLCDVGWGSNELACIEQCKSALQQALLLAHSDPDKLLAVYTDASGDHWGAAITQILRDHASRPLSEQQRQPLMMLSG